MSDIECWQCDQLTKDRIHCDACAFLDNDEKDENNITVAPATRTTTTTTLVESKAVQNLPPIPNVTNRSTKHLSTTASGKRCVQCTDQLTWPCGDPSSKNWLTLSNTCILSLILINCYYIGIVRSIIINLPIMIHHVATQHTTKLIML
jgi:hypothetical protein